MTTSDGKSNSSGACFVHTGRLHWTVVGFSTFLLSPGEGLGEFVLQHMRKKLIWEALELQRVKTVPWGPPVLCFMVAGYLGTISGRAQGPGNGTNRTKTMLFSCNEEQKTGSNPNTRHLGTDPGLHLTTYSPTRLVFGLQRFRDVPPDVPCYVWCQVHSFGEITIPLGLFLIQFLDRTFSHSS